MPETAILEPPKAYIFLLIGLFFSINCTELSEYDRVQIEEALADSLISTTESNNVLIRFLEKEQLKLQIVAGKAETINRNGESETRFSGDVEIEIYDDELNPSTRVRAKRATYFPKIAEFELFEGVYVQNADSSRLTTEYLKWDRDNGQISTPEFVIIVTQSDSISGSGFTGKDDLSEYSIADGSGITTINN